MPALSEGDRERASQTVEALGRLARRERGGMPTERSGKCVTTHVPATRRVCLGCGAGFTPRRPWHRYCAPRCRQRSYLKRQIAAEVERRLQMTP